MTVRTWSLTMREHFENTNFSVDPGGDTKQPGAKKMKYFEKSPLDYLEYDIEKMAMYDGKTPDTPEKEAK